MRIIDLSFGKFPEISYLNPRFRPGSLKLKLVLDVSSRGKTKKINFEKLYKKIHRLFPTLHKHKCCVSLLYGSLDSLAKKDLPIEEVGGVTDLAHLLEHMIIDLVSFISQMKTVSGITCGYKIPLNRFDLFVECKEKNVARFSCHFSLFLLKEFLSKKRLSKRHQRIIQLAKYIFDNTSLVFYPEKISSFFGWRKSYTKDRIKELIKFKYFIKEELEPSDSLR